MIYFIIYNDMQLTYEPIFYNRIFQQDNTKEIRIKRDVIQTSDSNTQK